MLNKLLHIFQKPEMRYKILSDTVLDYQKT